MNYRYLEDIHTGQQFEVSKGGIVKWPGMNVVKKAYFHLHNWKLNDPDTWESKPSPQDQMLTRLKELRRKNKIFKWVDYDKTVKGFVIIHSWRKNKYDFVVNGYEIENNLVLMQYLEEK